VLTVVTGPPCSGKSTYVREHAAAGDIVVDFDVIAQALGSPVSHGHGDFHRRVTFAARDAAIRESLALHRRGAVVWVVDSRPSAPRRRQYNVAHARFVNLSATAEELHARASACRPEGWHALIDEFLAGGPGPVSRAW
jgi:uncharacterized protein